MSRLGAAVSGGRRRRRHAWRCTECCRKHPESRWLYWRKADMLPCCREHAECVAVKGWVYCAVLPDGSRSMEVEL